MSAIIEPRCTSTCSTSTAVRPPNLRMTVSATRIGSGFATPGSESIVASAARAAASRSPESAESAALTVSSACIECALPLVAENPLWTEDDEGHKPQSDQDKADSADLRGVHDRFRYVAGADRLAENLVGELDEQPENDGADNGAKDAGGTPENHDRVGEERDLGRVAVGGHRPRGQREDEAAKAADDTTHDEGLHLVREDVLAKAADGVLILTDPLEHPSPRTAHQQVDDQAAERDEDPADRQHPHGPIVEADRPDAIVALSVWVDVEEGA